MNGKLLGAALLIAGGCICCWSWIKDKRSQIYLMREFAAALERMEGMIRWQNLPMTRVLEAENVREPCGMYFKNVLTYMNSGSTLQHAWKQAFEPLPNDETGELMCRMDLQGDARQMTGALRLTAQELRTRAAERAAQQQERERLCVAVGGCLTAVVVIVLI